MSSIMPRALPCIRCKTTMVKTGGPTGMCSACRTADPALAEVQRQNAKTLKRGIDQWVQRNSRPVPGQPGLRRVDMNKVLKGGR